MIDAITATGIHTCCDTCRHGTNWKINNATHSFRRDRYRMHLLPYALRICTLLPEDRGAANERHSEERTDTSCNHLH
ncbi:hypothetical protein THIX_60584 [Thiomonas sp. X19]|nr:hypothetical protein THIX_60584 [Thiomonas sp. X19]